MTHMSWNLMEEYLTLHSEFETTPFKLDDASKVLNKPPGRLRYDMHVLNRNLALNRVERGIYSAVDPDKWAGILTALKKFPGLRPFFQEILPQLPHIDSIMLYGSRVRGDHREDSDYDILIVTDGRLLFSEEDEERLKRQGFQVNEGYETELRQEIREAPVFIVPVLREAWPIFNKRVKRSLLRSYRKENLLKDLSRISDEILQILGADASTPDMRRSILYVSFARGRHLYLMETLLQNRPVSTSDWLERMGGAWQMDRPEIENLHKLYKEIELGRKPSMRYITDKRLQKITEGNARYLSKVVNSFEGTISG